MGGPVFWYRDKALKCYPGPLLCYWVEQFGAIPLQAVDNGVLRLHAKRHPSVVTWGITVITTIRQLWTEDHGQDVAEYAVMLAVILVIVIGTVRLIGGNANNVFNQVSNQLGQ
jgi:Flp pilus assembly pilin Flp